MTGAPWLVQSRVCCLQRNTWCIRSESVFVTYQLPLKLTSSSWSVLLSTTMTSYEIHSKMAMQIHSNTRACHKTSSKHCRGALPLIQLGVDTTRLGLANSTPTIVWWSRCIFVHTENTHRCPCLPVYKSFLSCRRRSGIAGAGLSLYAYENNTSDSRQSVGEYNVC